MTAPDNVCVVTHDRGSVEPKCHAGLQEQEAVLSTQAVFINDSEAPKLVNLQTVSLCDRQVTHVCFQPSSHTEARTGGH